MQSIKQEVRDYYNKIKSIDDSSGYSQSYQLGQIWRGGGGKMRTLLNIIKSDASPEESIKSVQNTYMFSINPSGPIKERMVDWHIAGLMEYGYDISNQDFALQESSLTNLAVCVYWQGRRLTPDFLRTVILCLEIQKYCHIPKSKARIVELGGGCGYFARTLKFFIPDSVHILIDLPETLYFAYIFLKLNFPKAKTCYVTDPVQLKDGIQEFDFVFIPTIFAESILQYKFDLFCNTRSLGEMSNPVIRYWMDFLQKQLEVKYFFGLNRFLNTISLHSGVGQRRLSENECSVLFNADWRVLSWEVEPPFDRCPYIETLGARNLKIIAEHLPEGSTSECDRQLRSREITEDLMDEDWACFLEGHRIGTMRGNALANDLTMRGTLFKLWESIRLYPNKTNVAMMLEYLHTLTKMDFPFEEWFYYRNLLKKLVSSKATLVDGKYEGLWRHALALGVSYNPLNIRAWAYQVIRFLPSFLRPKRFRLRKEL